ncbi:MAG: Do family serine endopeptidase [Deltaproteobacteria bacterium]
MRRKQWNRRLSLLSVVTILVMLAPWNLSAAEKSSQSLTIAKDLGNAFVEVAKTVKPSVVAIRSERTVTVSPGEGFGEDFFKGSPFEDFFKRYGGPPKKQKQVGEGSGVIVDQKGYILTNHHVVAGADKLSVHLFDGREVKGTLQGTDPKTDLAVIRVEAKDLSVGTLGDSDKIQVGEWAIAIGSPFGLEETVTVGVISAKGRTGFGTGTYEDFLQTDASINPGNSGGPLVNIDGEVVGINAMIIQPGQGIGFAIPINLAKTIMLQLIDRGKVVRPWVGISLQDLSPELMKSFNVTEKEGALVSQIFEGSPAEKAGFRVGDIVSIIDGIKIMNSQDVVREVLKKQVGQQVRFVVLREGKELEIPVTTVEMPAEKKDAKVPQPEMKEWLGLHVTAVTPDIAKDLGLSKAEGVILQEVDTGSSGANAGLRKGDVILEVNRQKIKDEDDYQRVMDKVKPDQGALFLVSRGGSTFFVSLKEEK